MDLTGQAAAESLGPQMYSGIGGQMTFMMGAMYSPGGRSIMVLPSTARKGTLSRIVPTLEPGSTLTTPRQYADYVVTEFGIVNLQGKTQRQRAEALISIAHPDFQPEFEERRAQDVLALSPPVRLRTGRVRAARASSNSGETAGSMPTVEPATSAREERRGSVSDLRGAHTPRLRSDVPGHGAGRVPSTHCWPAPPNFTARK